MDLGGGRSGLLRSTLAPLVHTARTGPGDLALVAVMLVMTCAGEDAYQSRRRARPAPA